MTKQFRLPTEEVHRVAKENLDYQAALERVTKSIERHIYRETDLLKSRIQDLNLALGELKPMLDAVSKEVALLREKVAELEQTPVPTPELGAYKAMLARFDLLFRDVTLIKLEKMKPVLDDYFKAREKLVKEVLDTNATDRVE